MMTLSNEKLELTVKSITYALNKVRKKGEGIRRKIIYFKEKESCQCELFTTN